MEKAKPTLLELKDLKETETKRLTAFFNINFGLTNDTLEERIEKGVDFIPEGYALLKKNIDFYIRVRGWITSWGQTDRNAIKSLPQKIKLVALR
ncbi:MAG: hypothetical protein GY705_24155 [Bacteroidetes bacterium]|nr:hypothetical protein [Bacteroidota bacterium]